MIYGTDQEKFQLYNNPYQILWIMIAVIVGALILIIISKYRLTDFD